MWISLDQFVVHKLSLHKHASLFDGSNVVLIIKQHIYMHNAKFQGT